VLFIFQFRTWLTKPDLSIRDSSFLKVAHRTQWRAEGGGSIGETAPGFQSKVGTPRVKLQQLKCCSKMIFTIVM